MLTLNIEKKKFEKFFTLQVQQKRGDIYIYVCVCVCVHVYVCVCTCMFVRAHVMVALHVEAVLASTCEDLTFASICWRVRLSRHAAPRHVQSIADRVALNLEIILKTFSTNQNSAHGIHD